MVLGSSNKGRRLGDEAWEEVEKWVLGMTERGSMLLQLKCRRIVQGAHYCRLLTIIAILVQYFVLMAGKPTISWQIIWILMMCCIIRSTIQKIILTLKQELIPRQ